MLTLYDNPFSPFTRKIRLLLFHKDLPFRSIDALALDELEGLRQVHPRAEVPVLVDGDLIIAESADIAAYLDELQPHPGVMPIARDLRVKARRWQRDADHVFDAIVHDISLWSWPTHRRNDEPPKGLVDVGHRDLRKLVARLESELDCGDYLCGDAPSIADFALFPHITSLRFVGVELDDSQAPRTLSWQRRMRDLPAVQKDLEVVRRGVTESFGDRVSPYEDERVVWRGDRIEWLLSQGFDQWWFEERAAGRAVVPSSL